MLDGQFVENAFTRGGKANKDFTAVVGCGLARNGAALDHAIDEFDGTVMTDLKPGGKLADGGEFSDGQSFDGEEKLMLLRLDAVGAGSFFAIAKEETDLMSKLGEAAIGGQREVAGGNCHIYIVSRHFPYGWWAL